MASTKKADLVDRLYAKISRRPTKTGCRLWRGGTKFGRTTEYGKIRAAGAGSRIWNVQRLVLLLETAVAEVPRDPFEPIDVWVKRANRWYHDQGLEASHQCDNSLCCVVGIGHLVWETHDDNVKHQAERRRQRRNVAVGSPETAQSAVA